MRDKPAKEKRLNNKIHSDLAPISLRVHSRVVNEKPRKDGERRMSDKWANFALVFDCETTIDIRQDLNFLWWRFCELKEDAYVCQHEGLVYADALDAESIHLIRTYARNLPAEVEAGCPADILVQSRTEFVDGEFWEAIQAGATIVCFNAPFDLSRLALEYREAQSKNTGWSMVLWTRKGGPDTFRPKLRIKPKDSRSAFISLAGGEPNNRAVYRGRFLDLSVLGWALRNRHMTLNGFLDSFGLEGKIDHEPTGRVTKKELAYGRRDVERTVVLLNAMKREYEGFPIKLSPERAMSAASITKAFLDKMGIEQPSHKFDLPDKILGRCMQAYYGGRSEIRIRHQEVPVVSKHPEGWLTREYTEIHSGDTVKLSDKYHGRTLSPQTLSTVIWRHYLHPEDKSLSPNGEPCNEYTKGLLLRRPVTAMLPFDLIGKEVERRGQEGEDPSLLENAGPIQYQRHQTANTRAADAGLILRARKLLKAGKATMRGLTRDFHVSQHAIERFLDGERVHPPTRLRIAKAVEKLERETRDRT